MPLETTTSDPTSGDIAVFLLRLPQKNCHQSTPQFRSAIDRLIRWTLVNQGFVGVEETMRTRSLHDEANIHVSLVDMTDSSFRAHADFNSGVCVVSIWHRDWTAELFECAVRVVDWLISAGIARSVISITPPARFLQPVRLQDLRTKKDTAPDSNNSEYPADNPLAY